MAQDAYKLLLTPLGAASDHNAATRWAEALPRRPADVMRIEIDHLDAEVQQAHERAMGRTGGLPEWTIIVSLWASAVPEQPPAGFTMTPVTVRDRIGYGFENDRPGSVPGYKKFSFWKAKAGVPSDRWDALYAHHIETVPALQPIWRYRQNIIAGKPDDFPFDAISENWWMTVHDLTDGHFLSPEAKLAVYAETGKFLDFAVTASFVCRNTALFIA